MSPQKPTPSPATSPTAASPAPTPSGRAVWRLRAGSDRRFRAGHPWVYSNELVDSPKGVEPGALVELRDGAGGLLALGYGNPHSLISFRVLTRDAATRTHAPDSEGGLLDTLRSATQLRRSLGLTDVSYRLCFAEADGLPGLIIDRYRVDVTPAAQVLVVQAQTAGADRLIAALKPALEKWADTESGIPWSRTSLVLNHDVSVRALEGLEPQRARLEREIAGVDPRALGILVQSASVGDPLRFDVDLIEGQKTGFFLDQAANIRLAAQLLAGLRPAQAGMPLRILDLCCYVGQWSAQLTRIFKQQGLNVEATLVDASAKALELAQANVSREGAQVKTLKGDVLKDLPALTAGAYDLVISDPPALIKGRKDIGPGTHAYLQLNTQVFRLVRPRGAVVSCSCSSLLEEGEFMRVLGKAASRNSARAVWVGRGAQAPDHPMLAEFPEGQYLKGWIGWVQPKL